MKHFCKMLSLFLAVLICLGALAGCLNTNPSGEDTTADTTADTEPNSGTTDGKVEYTITVKSAGGMALSGIVVYVYTDETLDDVVNYTTTNADGVAKLSLKQSSSYVATLSGLPEGYAPDTYYPLTGAATAITVTSSVVNSTDHSSKSYKLGDVMRDFEVVDSDGNTIKLSELLKVKKMVLINFWYTTCSWCVKEFPYMNTAYEQYRDDIEIVALNHYNKDSEADVKSFKETTPLSFPMAKDYTGMASAFNLQGYPTSVVVDRYGVICLIEAGGIVSETPFITMFEHFTAENYEQKLFASLDELTPPEKPNVTMPSTEEIFAAFNSGSMTVTYAAQADGEVDEMSWPFIIGQKDGKDCIISSNAGRDSSYATLYANVTLKKGDVLAFDYWASCEQGADVLYLLVDRKDIYQISGEDTGWNTCYTYVAPEDGEYEVAFCYLKDSSDRVGDDTVYLKDFRVVKESDIDQPTYIPRYAANHLAADGFGYEDYVSVVYNETDGYYHVGTANGPLLLVDFMKATRFSNTPVYLHAYNGDVVIDGVDYHDRIEVYANYAVNGSIYGLCPVNADLKELLEKVALAVGLEHDNPNQWLQMCLYYDAYGTDGVQLGNPILGLCPDTAYEAVENTPIEVYYDRVIMPRGFFYKFTPTKTGAYRITTDSQYAVEGWIMLEDLTEFYVHEGGERMYYDAVNISMVVFLEAGTDYYIDICFFDPTQLGGFTYEIEYLGEDYKHLTIASPGYFTFPDGNEDDPLAEILAGGIEIALGEDGYYHEKRADGTLGSVLYADFIGYTDIFGEDTLSALIEKGAFDFTLTDSDEYILNYVKLYGDNTKAELERIWGEEYEARAEIYLVDDVLAGKTHGTGTDRTDEIKVYLDRLIATSEEAPELEGCVPVDAALAELLQALMDKYTFAGVDDSWRKLCYYYQTAQG